MDSEHMERLLRKLHLRRIREVFQDWIDRSSRDGTSYGDFLLGLLEEETAAREERRLARLVRQADFPFDKTLEQFDFRRHPELRRQLFQSYLDASFVREGRALVLIGAPGLGKTHLATAVAIHLVQRGFTARFVQVQNLVNRILRADSPRERERALRPYAKCDVLVLDELGYLAPDAGTGPLLYELIAQRYERRATIITSNKSVTEWGRVLSDTALAAALIDRLMHHGDVFYLKGQSYRLRDKPLLIDPPIKPKDEEPSGTSEPSKATAIPIAKRNVMKSEAPANA